MAIRYQQVRPDELSAYNAAAAALEGAVSYPLGRDRFTLDHGADYFAFFRRLGEPHYRFAWDGGRLIGMMAAVLRRVPLSVDKPPQECWYICDVKVSPRYQARGVALKLVTLGFAEAYARCPRAYAISMNPSDGSNPLVRLVRRWFQRGPGGETAGTLHLYTANHDEMQRLQPGLQGRHGPISYRSLRGIKDVVLESTHQPMDLWHVQWGPTAEPQRTIPVPGAQHMFCSVVSSENTEPMATATLLHHGMAGCDWSFVLTSDI